MNQEEKLKQYCKTHLLKTSFEYGFMYLNDEEQYEILDSETLIFDEDFDFIPQIQYEDSTGFVYEFCGRWFLQKVGEEVSMNELRYIGEADQRVPINSFLGIHSGNEMLNGVGMYEDWIRKAKFLGIKNLAICEKHTLAGVIDFQNQCKKAGIKPIVGYTLNIKKNETNFLIKLYAKDFQGWQNLLKFNKLINVDGQIAVDEEFLLQNLEGLVVVLDPKSMKFEDRPNCDSFYQVDTVVFENEEEDIEYLNNLEKFLSSDLPPVAIYDAYYLEQQDWQAREVLWKIAKKFDSKTQNQYFKNFDQYATELIELFEQGNTSWQKLFKKSVANLEIIADLCNFEYDTANRRLPRYPMTPEQKEKFGTNEDYFLHLIKQGFKDRGIKPEGEYLDRLKEEVRVLKKGDVIDYFLILHDIIQAEKKEGGLVGIGRGSAGGSLVSYLLEIIQINPLEYGLLFERFLNDGRMGEMKECIAYKINDELTLNEGSILRVLRDGVEKVVKVEDLKEGDEILKYD